MHWKTLITPETISHSDLRVNLQPNRVTSDMSDDKQQSSHNVRNPVLTLMDNLMSVAHSVSTEDDCHKDTDDDDDETGFMEGMPSRYESQSVWFEEPTPIVAALSI